MATGAALSPVQGGREVPLRTLVKPNRGEPEVPAQALPADVVHLLISRVGPDEAEIAAMTKDEAVARLKQFWIDGS